MLCQLMPQTCRVRWHIIPALAWSIQLSSPYSSFLNTHLMQVAPKWDSFPGMHMAGMQGHKFILKTPWCMNAKLIYASDTVQTFTHLPCKASKYICTCSTFKSQASGLTPGLAEVSCISWDLIPVLQNVAVCVSESVFLLAAMTDKNKKRAHFLYSCCLSISVFITWALSKAMEREERLSRECFHIPAIWARSCLLSPLTMVQSQGSTAQPCP